MKKFYILTVVSLLGFFIAITGVYFDDKAQSGDTQAIPTMKLPFNSFIAATGIIEAKSKNIVIGSLVSGVIKEIHIKNGQKIKKGDLLFTLDNKRIKNEIALLQTQRSVLLAKLKAVKDQFSLIKEFKHLSSQMVTSEKFKSKEDAYKVAQALLKAQDEKLSILKYKKEFYKIYAPVDGVVLSSKLTVGSYFNKNNPQDLLVVGSNKLNLNVSINEYDIWKFEKESLAVAFVRGHSELKTNIKYLYTVPFVTPKVALTGKSTEQTDTRVLHVVYALDTNRSFALYVGQQLDVFIKTDR